jgi:uncharacterized protein (DUF58 family)
MKIDFARLNYVLIPKTAEEIERFRKSLLGRALGRIGTAWFALTEEGQMVVILTMIVGAFAIDVRGTSTYVLFSILCGLLVGSVVAGRAIDVEGLEVRVSAPRHVTVSEIARFAVTCTSSRAATLPPLRVHGPFLPWSAKWLDLAPREIAPDADGSARTELGARFLTRGVFHLGPFVAHPIAPLGLSRGPIRWSEPRTIYVVPRIANVALPSPGPVPRARSGRASLAALRGEATDLRGVRPYRPGDPVRALHARSWGRTGSPVVREYLQEQVERVGVILDPDFEAPEHLEAAIELVAGIVARLCHGEAIVELTVAAGDADRFEHLVLRRGQPDIDVALELLASVARGRRALPPELDARMGERLASLSTVILVSGAAPDDLGALVASIRAHGPSCRSVMVDDAIARAVKTGEPVACG